MLAKFIRKGILLYSPERFTLVDSVLQMWAGDEEVLLQTLEKQKVQRDAVYDFYKKYLPHRMNEVPLVLRSGLARRRHL